MLGQCSLDIVNTFFVITQEFIRSFVRQSKVILSSLAIICRVKKSSYTSFPSFIMRGIIHLVPLFFTILIALTSESLRRASSAIGTPLEWPEAKKAADHVRKWGIEVCISCFVFNSNFGKFPYAFRSLSRKMEIQHGKINERNFKHWWKRRNDINHSPKTRVDKSSLKFLS